MKDLKIRLIRNKEELEQVFRIREIVFIRGQKVPRQRERDGFDKSAKHVIVFYRKNPIGCARIRFIGEKAKLERIALLKRYRNKGFGKILMDYLISYCKKKRLKRFFCTPNIILRIFMRNGGLYQEGKHLWMQV